MEHKFEVDVYRKPTTTDTALHVTSNHPMDHKLAVYCFLINQVNHLPLSSDRKVQGMNVIVRVLRNIGFSSGHNT
jgi:hypothetical protein